MKSNKSIFYSLKFNVFSIGRYFTIILFLSLANVIHAQESLSVYMEQAGKNNPGLQAKYLEYSAALEKVPQVGALPDLTAQLGFFLNPMQLLGGNQVGNMQLMQMFPWFGTLTAAKDEASQMALMKFEAARDARNMLYSQVKTSWYNIYRKKQEIRILNENLELLRTLEKVALSKYANAKSPGGSSGNISSGSSSAPVASGNQTTSSAPSGMNGMSGGSSAMGSNGSGMVDVLRVQMEIAELINRIEVTKDMLGTEIARFNSLLNRPSETEVHIPANLSPVLLPLELNAMADSLKNNPMLRMSLAEKAAGEAQRVMATKMRKPMLGVGVNYMLIDKRPGNTSMMNGNDMIMPMVSFTVPFFSKKYKAMEREAKFRIEASEKSYENTRNDLEVSFLDKVQQFKDANRRLALYKNQAALAKTSVQLLLTAFSTSNTDFDEVLRMQAQLLDYGLKELDALTDRNTTGAQLEYIAGL
ncbi:MAG: TolC family protein [Peptostreptococcaceae bacterium]|nr:TolC family protein [Peptostreptococcaceae bacterium]